MIHQEHNWNLEESMLTGSDEVPRAAHFGILKLDIQSKTLSKLCDPEQGSLSEPVIPLKSREPDHL